MTALITLALNAVFDGIGERLDVLLVNTVMTVMTWVNSLSTSFFSSELVQSAQSFSRWLSYFVLAGALIVTLVDIAEELANVKPGQSIEYLTIGINFLKGLLFIEMAPVLAQQSIIIGANLSGAFRVDSSSITNGSFNPSPLIMIIILIALVSFFCMSLFSVGAMFLQALTVFLYVPDIVRGRTTSMGDWIRQTLSILVTYMFRNVLFFIGFTSAINLDIIAMSCAWITMIGAAKLLQKFGMSSGFGGAVSSTVSIGQSAFSTIAAIAR